MDNIDERRTRMMLESTQEETPRCEKAENYELCVRFVKAFEIIGKKWNGLIISSLCDTKAMRFKDLTHAVGACSDRVLVERLRELEADGIVKRSMDEDSKIVLYTLTQKGAELKPVFNQVHEWADKWI